MGSISVCEYIYDMLQQRYGLHHVAERKFVSVLSACLFYQNQSARVRLFGRFLGVYDALTS